MSAELSAAIAGAIGGVFSGSVAAWVRGRFEIKKMEKARKQLLADREEDAAADLRAAAAALVHALSDEDDFTGRRLNAARQKVEIAKGRTGSGTPQAAAAAALLAASTSKDVKAAEAAERQISGM